MTWSSRWLWVFRLSSCLGRFPCGLRGSGVVVLGGGSRCGGWVFRPALWLLSGADRPPALVSGAMVAGVLKPAGTPTHL
ncbi:hypothetical protein AB0D67_20595, partial [Streptosporangium sp. NPDC048047]|uniref:hypothetical protein n=1 Tax=Streptosporangium sp. NPDC048047 TaxID=3155748 RepID=UPI00341EBE88